MSKKTKINYRKLYKEYYGYSEEQMAGMDVHHIDGNRENNDMNNLQLMSIKDHAKLHNNDFVAWSRIGAKLGNAAFRKRLVEDGPTKKELAYRKILSKRCRDGLHRVPHSEQTKKIISEKKKQEFLCPENHPMWGNTTYEITDPNGLVYVVSGGFKEWCMSRGLQPSNIRKVAQGKRKHNKGWTAKIK